ncbi:lipoprotein-releasing ABC transporter permease subunit LolE [Lacimicrobium alkaliphilum]|uniref:Cell division protein FtsX n=1 Tax=Lacimicrobium alkaliphilum TaxID=1526571 RepID=A0A0U2ZIJ5_9ALTE|nr:lipoprotein-releasing ABC transporter permease subunit LolE [Lacimicrobium alkaliphilum]ALS98807.1 cell division protein FtsX [Lacimicrobium alkaliphilum]
MSLLGIQLAWRFRQGKGQNGFASFISASSTVGIALGCFVMILLLSVMNGFEKELKDRLLAVIPHGELIAVSPKGMQNWQQHSDVLQQDPRIAYLAPVTKMMAMVQTGTRMKAVEVTGIQTDSQKQARIREMTSPEQWQRFSSEANSILLGQGVLDKLDVQPGQKIQLLMPQQRMQGGFKPPKSVWFEVAGTLRIGGELDNHLAMVHLAKASQVLGVDYGAQGLEFGFSDPFVAPELMRELGFAFEQHVYISDWTRTHGHLYQDIQLVRAVVYLALTLLIAVACFNIVSTLVMAVNDKRHEIAMLKTLGARDSLIIQSFMLQGVFNGLIGTLAGILSGVLVSVYLSELALWLENLIGVQLLSGDIYFIDFLPSQVKPAEVMITAVIALSLSVLATLYPAVKASRIEPAKVLNH